MNAISQRSTVFVAVTLFGIAISVMRASATVLTFDLPVQFNFQVPSQLYGDNVTSTTMGAFGYGAAAGFTPNVAVEYFGSPALWTTGYGDLTNVLFDNADNTGIIKLTLTADPGYEVRLHSFDLAAYASSFGADPGIDSVRVFDSANAVVFEQSRVIISLARHASIDLRAPLSDTSLRIEIDARNLGNLNDDIGIDNVTFSQVASVPEPATLALAAAGVTALLATSRRRL